LHLVLSCLALALALAAAGARAVADSPQDGDRRWPELPPWPEWVTAEESGFQVKWTSSEETKLCLRWVIPLPKHTHFKGKLILPVTNLAVRLRASASDVEQNALQELEAILPEKASARDPDGRFPILIGVSDAEGKIDGTPIPGAARLRELKNEDQAYLITPLSEPGIAVTGLTERGVYYGVKTLQQLLEGRLDQDHLTVPIVRVLDWPDLAERGQWGGSSAGDIQYLADRKMNLIEAHSQFWIDDQGRGRASIDTESQGNARLHAIKWVPMSGRAGDLRLRRVVPSGILDAPASDA